MEEEKNKGDIVNGLKGALRALVRPIAVVTAEHEGARYAMAATAFCEVSMDPPSMLVCINRNNATFAAVSRCAISVKPAAAGFSQWGLSVPAGDCGATNGCTIAQTRRSKRHDRWLCNDGPYEGLLLVR